MHKRHKWQFSGFIPMEIKYDGKKEYRKMEFVCHCGKVKRIYEKR